MGNAASARPNQPGGGTHRDAPHDLASKDHQAKRQQPRRRDSVPALPNARGAAVPPSASLESAQATQVSPRASTAASTSNISHTRVRSSTTAAPPSQPMEGASNDLERSASEKHHSSAPTQPVQVPPHPTPTDPAIQNSLPGEDDPFDAASPGFFAPNSQYGRPPRLPLPIEEEVLSPGSPIISPADVSGPIGRDDIDEPELPRRSSVLSSTTADDEEALDDFQAAGRAAGQMVDTLVEWKEGGDKVYVTGSFSGWNKKHRLHKNGPSKDPTALSAVIPLLVGAHHMTFLVDGQMRTSIHLPTAVDYTNVLINYVEVSPEDAHKSVVDREGPATQAHVAVEAKDMLPVEQQPTAGDSPSGQSLPPPTPDLRPTHKSGVLSAGPSGIATPVTRPATEEAQAQARSREGSRSPQAQQPPVFRRVPNNLLYHSEIPAFLVDLDAPEDSHRAARANAVMSTQPTPPSLPMFLNKSILNLTLPVKDDASVLPLPNHTVLNHLATTSIKQNVLATSSTTRYKRKHVTTIFHKPTNDHGD